MARWIPLTLFNVLYEKESDLLSPEGHARFIQRLESAEGDAICSKHVLRLNEFHAFKESVKRPETIVFQGWVEQNPILKETLLKEKVDGYFEDKRGVLKHTLSNEFKKYVTPYLTPILLGDPPETMKEFSWFFSLSALLDSDTGPTVEAQLFKGIRKYLLVLKETHILTEEQELIKFVKPLCDDAIIDSINNLSKASYALKMEYVDAILEVIRTPACTVRFANWILKQMDRLTLNKEHNDKLRELRKELATGNLQVKKFDKAKSSTNWKLIITITVVVLLITIGYLILVFKPFSDPEVYNAYDHAEMEEFSKEELAEIDSLVHEMEFESFLEGEEIDPNIIIQRSNYISIRKPYKNSLMEQIFVDVNKDVTLQENYYIDSCGPEVAFQRYPGVQDLSQRIAAKEVLFRNESDYDLIVYVTPNKSTGGVYSMYVKSGSTVTFRMDVDDMLTTVAGNKFTQFYPPKGSKQDEKPSQAFRYHFCETDDNYFESINTSLRLLPTTRTSIKFMVTGHRGSDYSVVDVYDVAELY